MAVARTLGGRNKRDSERIVPEDVKPTTHARTEQPKPMTENDVMKMYHAMEGKSQQEIQQELFRMVEQETRAGTFDPSQLNGFYQMAAPMLNEEQKKQMAELIQRIQGRF